MTNTENTEALAEEKTVETPAVTESAPEAAPAEETPTSPSCEAENKRLVDAIKGVIRVADRKTVEFDEAKAALAQGEK